MIDTFVLRVVYVFFSISIRIIWFLPFENKQQQQKIDSQKNELLCSDHQSTRNNLTEKIIFMERTHRVEFNSAYEIVQNLKHCLDKTLLKI